MEDITTKDQLQRAMDRVARASYGVLWTEVLHDLGASKAQIQSRVERRVLRREARGVFVVSAVPHSWEEDVMIVCRRAPGRVWIAGEAAAALMELDGCRRPGLRSDHRKRAIEKVEGPLQARGCDARK